MQYLIMLRGDTSVDTVVLKDLNQNDVTIEIAGERYTDILIKSNSGNDALLLKDHIKGSDYRVEKLQFADGTELSGDQIYSIATQNVKFGTENDDQITGGSEDNVILPGSGNDTIKSGSGNDLYLFEKGFGKDRISDYGYNKRDDVIKFIDIASTDVEFRLSETSQSDLIMKVTDSDDELIFSSYFYSEYGNDFVKKVEFSDGVVWSKEDVKREVSEILKSKTVDLASGFGDMILRYDGYYKHLDSCQFDLTDTNAEDVKLEMTNAGLKLLNAKTGDSILFNGRHDIRDGYTFNFANEVIWSGAESENMPVVIEQIGTDEQDAILGSVDLSDHIKGNGGNDYLVGKGGYDILDGGTGDDKLEQSGTHETIFRPGQDSDRVISNADKSILELNSDFGYDSLEIKENTELLIRFTEFNSSDIELEYNWGRVDVFSKTPTGRQFEGNLWFKYDSTLRTSEIEFADGEHWDSQAVKNYFSDVKTHTVEKGFGHKEIAVRESLDGDIVNDSIHFADINPDDLTWNVAMSHGPSALEMTVKSTGDTLILPNFVDFLAFPGEKQADAIFSSIRFADGTVWDSGKVIEKLSMITSFGTKEDDSLYGHFKMNNTMYGYAGNDKLNGGDGSDYLYGGAGDDTLSSGSGIDTIDSGSGNDTIEVAEGEKTIMFGRGYGKDVISSFRWVDEHNMKVKFLDLNKEDVIIKVSDDPVKSVSITLVDSPDSLVFNIDSPVDQWMKLEFESGELIQGSDLMEKINIDQLAPNSVFGTDGKDLFNSSKSTEGIDKFYGLGGVDEFYLRDRNSDGSADEAYGGDGNDIFNIDSKNVYVNGGNGSDIYRIGFPTGNVNIDLDSTESKSDTLDISRHALDAFDISIVEDTIKLKHKYANLFVNVSNFYDEASSTLKLGTIEYMNSENGNNESISLIDLLGQLDCSQSTLAQLVLRDASSNNTEAIIDVDMNSYDIENIDISAYGPSTKVKMNFVNMDYDEFVFNASADGVAIKRVSDDSTKTIKFSNSQLVTDIIFKDTSVKLDEIWQTIVSNNAPTDGADNIFANSDSSVHGGSGDDVLFSITDSNAELHGDSGDDELTGGKGNDRLYGGSDDDVLRGDEGRDYLSGDDGDDRLYGDNGDDILYGGKGRDYLNGGNGEDEIHGGADSDKLYGKSGNDVLYGDEGNDKLYGSYGNDVLYGGNGNDYLKGSYDADTIYGGDGNDYVNGGSGDDKLYGGSGEDDIYTSTGTDYIDGGLGNDAIYVKDGTKTIKLGMDSGDDRVSFYRPSTDANIIIHAENLSKDQLEVLVHETQTDIRVKGTTNRILLEKSDSVTDWLSLKFDDGTVLSGSELAMYIAGDNLPSGPNLVEGTTNPDRFDSQDCTNRTDIFHGNDGNDRFNLKYSNSDGSQDEVYGEAGNDSIDIDQGQYILVGGDGEDYYSINSTSDGHIVVDLTSSDLASDTLNLLYDLTSENVRVLDNELQVVDQYGGTAVTIKNFYDETNKALKLSQITYMTISEEGSSIPGGLPLPPGGMGLPPLPGGIELPPLPSGLPTPASTSLYELLSRIDCSNSSMAQNLISDVEAGNAKIFKHMEYGQPHIRLSDFDKDEKYEFVIDIPKSEVVVSPSGNGFSIDRNGQPQYSFIIDDVERDNISFKIGNESISLKGMINTKLTLGEPTVNDDKLALFNINEISGGLGHDLISSLNVSDVVIHGNEGDDYIYGFQGNDTLYGDGDDDYIYGHQGNDTIYGGQGDDVLYGDEGNDILYGGKGNDELLGEAGNDIYMIESEFGVDEIDDYEGFDKIIVDGNFKEMIFKNASDSWLDYKMSTSDGVNNLYFDAGGDAIDFMEFNNGTITGSNIQALIQAMNTYVSEQGVSNWSEALEKNKSEAEALMVGYFRNVLA